MCTLQRQFESPTEGHGQAGGGERPLLEEALQGRRETLVDRHPSTLASIYNAGLILEAMGAAGAGGGK